MGPQVCRTGPYLVRVLRLWQTELAVCLSWGHSYGLSLAGIPSFFFNAKMGTEEAGAHVHTHTLTLTHAHTLRNTRTLFLSGCNMHTRTLSFLDIYVYAQSHMLTDLNFLGIVLGKHVIATVISL